MIAYPLGTSGQSLILTDAVLSHFEHHRQLAPQSKEAGGQLFARFDGKITYIERATGPRPSDRRGLMLFVPNRLAERREIRRMFREGLHYVGDWHSHREPRPRPSRRDIDSFQDMFHKSRHNLENFVMVIVGTARPPAGLFVALCNREQLQRLSPCGQGL